MTLEAVVFQPQVIGGGGSWSHGYGFGKEEDKLYTDYGHILPNNNVGQGLNVSLECSPNSLVVQSVNHFDTNNSPSPENCIGFNGSTSTRVFSPMEAPTASIGRRKRRRTRGIKNKEEMETQRKTHIAVERNRRKLMNDYLAELRAMMPASYAQRGDQASIIGGAINFVKELEQLLQSLEGHRQTKQQHSDCNLASNIFSDFFTFPQYSTCSSTTHGQYLYNKSLTAADHEKRYSATADVEVTMVESHANIKVLLKRLPTHQLLKMVLGFRSLGLFVLHLTVTTVDSMILYSFSVKVEENSQVTSMNEIAADVYEMVGRIQEEAQFSAQKPMI